VLPFTASPKPGADRSLAGGSTEHGRISIDVTTLDRPRSLCQKKTPGRFAFQRMVARAIATGSDT